MFETPKIPEKKQDLKIGINPQFQGFVPAEFSEDPFGYFETHGKNIKPGETVYEGEKIKEDPTAVKDFPVWTDENGNELKVVAKRVNTEKGKVGKTANPFYEADVMEKVRELGLPAPAPIARIQKEDEFLILMERAEGFTIFDPALQEIFQEKGYSEKDKEELKKDAEGAMAELQSRFEQAGVQRKWKLSDMVFQVDFSTKKITGITPVDWERTEIIGS
mgnify:CR=1 FL=1